MTHLYYLVLPAFSGPITTKWEILGQGTFPLNVLLKHESKREDTEPSQVINFSVDCGPPDKHNLAQQPIHST